MFRTLKIATAVTGILATAAAFVATPAFAAPGDCLQWDASGTWHLTQSNGTPVLLKIQQTGTHVQGVGEYSYYNNDSEKVQTIGGPVDGDLEHGSFLRVTVYWSNGIAGIYTGQIQLDGTMNGDTVDKNDPGNKATFRASGFPRCVARAEVPPPPPPTPAPVKPPVVVTQATELNDHSAVLAAFAAPKPPASGEVDEVNDHGAVSAAVAATPVPAPPATPIDPAKLDALAAVGADIAAQDPAVAEARNTRPNPNYQRGFDIASGIFGDPKLGALGNTLMGPGSEAIRATLSAAGQRGFDASVKFHQARKYR